MQPQNRRFHVPTPLARHLLIPEWGHKESNMHHDIHTTLGDLISIVYQEFMAQYDDPELAATATAASINDMLLAASRPGQQEEAA